jgi:methionine salvage enolase-phosphatase E1
VKGIHPRNIPARFGLIWVSGFRGKDLNAIFYKKYANLHNRYQSAERKISQTNPEYMINYSFPCTCSKNLSSFRFIIMQQWIIEEKSIFSNSSHLEWRADLSDTILKETHPRTIPARFGLIWFRGFRGEDLNVKVYDVRRTTDERRTPSNDKSCQVN